MTVGKGPKFTRRIVWLWLLAALLATAMVRCDPRGNGTVLRESRGRTSPDSTQGRAPGATGAHHVDHDQNGTTHAVDEVPFELVE